MLTEQARSSDASPTQNTILVGELHHRLQNTLAIVLALSRLTARTVDTVEEFQAAFSQRIEAMARTNSLLLRGQIQAVSVQVALETE
ncbi:MAG: sensor histidine kinase, partial [Oxalobacteraceae bacterium]